MRRDEWLLIGEMNSLGTKGWLLFISRADPFLCSAEDRGGYAGVIKIGERLPFTSRRELRR